MSALATITSAPRAPDAAGIAAAAAALQSGGLIGLPTETVYGLAGDAGDAQAVARIFSAKDRPRINPLIIHCADADAALALLQPAPALRALADAFWPGPLTLVGDAAADAPVCDLARAGLSTLAVRVPAHPVARAVLAAVDRPIAAPSANRSGRISPTTANAAATEIGGAASLTLNGGACAIGLESTVIDARGGQAVQLRPGGLTRAAIEAVVGSLGDAGDADADAPRSPGRLLRHYAPDRPIRLDADGPGGSDEGLLAFGPPPSGYAAVEQLSASRDLNAAAARLFAGMRALDRPPIKRIAVAPIPCDGLGEAINDRLARAAASARS